MIAYEYNPNATSCFVISAYAGYQHAVAMSEYHSLCALDCRSECRFTLAIWHDEQLDFWDKKASSHENDLTCACARELTHQVMREFRACDGDLPSVIKQFGWGLHLATMCLDVWNAQFS